MKSPRLRRLYYVEEVPEDLGDEQERCAVAIAQAEERSRIYHLPADWYIVWVRGNAIKVCQAYR